MLPMTQLEPSMESYSFKKRRPISIRLKRQAKLNRDQSEIPIKSGEPDPDDMYNVLVFAAENYVKLSNF